MNELELMLTDVCDCSRSELYANARTRVLKEREFARFDHMLKERSKDIPVQYSIGYTEFMGLRITVSPDVLIPRPETELLVEEALDIIRHHRNALSIVDIGTGSGCIALALAAFAQQPVTICAIDKSAAALRVAQQNAKNLCLAHRITFRKIDITHKSSFLQGHHFDLIISNPPYIPSRDIGTDDITTRYEPRCALDGGADGCDIYRALNRNVPSCMKKDGHLLFELPGVNTARVLSIFFHDWDMVVRKKDYNNLDRIAVLKRGGC